MLFPEQNFAVQTIFLINETRCTEDHPKYRVPFSKFKGSYSDVVCVIVDILLLFARAFYIFLNGLIYSPLPLASW